MRPLLLPLLLTATLALGGIFSSSPPEREPDPADHILAAIDPGLILPLSQAQRHQLRRHAERLVSAPPRAARCWSADADPAQVAAFLAAEEARRAMDPAPANGGPQEANQLDTRWSVTATDGLNQGTQGLPITLTWSIVPDGTPIPGDAGIGDPAGPSDLRAFLSGIYGGNPAGPPDQQPWFVHFQDVFDNIAAKTGITYVYEPTDDGIQMNFSNPGVLGVRGDIRIGGHDFDETPPFDATLAYNFFPNDGDMVIDTSDDWFQNNKDSPNHVGNLLEHEHGHGLGLNHVCPDNGTKLMEPFISTSFDGIQFDDIYSLQRHYGDFYEKHSSTRNNDSATAAAPVNVVPGTSFTTGWVSIDDDTDVDFYRFSAPVGSIITARAVPSTQSYLEGPQNQDCSATTTFDSSSIHNLTLTLLDPDQTTVLASATSNPAGQTEEITSFTTPSSGFHYLKVDGDFTNAAQLYRLEVDLTVPAVEIAIAAAPLVLESFAGGNGAPDPGETVQLDLTLANLGLVGATNVQAVLDPPSGFGGFTGFTTTAAYGTIDSAANATRSFVFALDAACGDTVSLNLTVTADGGYMVKLPLPVTLGALTDVLDASFDAPTLPAGWSATATGAGSGWTTSTHQAATGTHSVFAENVDGVGQSILTTPSVTLGTGTSTLSFANFHNTEAGTAQFYDGGVLEISINSGPWTDIVAAGATFTAGAYTGTINDNFDNPLGNRDAWSGDSGGFFVSTLTLPPAASGQAVRFRWILGTDESQDDVGWFIDNVSLFTRSCDPAVPILSLTLDDPTASEFAPLDTAGITISAPLPPAAPVAITPGNTGTADPATDVSGLDALVLPAGQTTLPVTIQAINDNLAEGDETLVLSIPGAPGDATITIQDTPYGQWAAGLIGPGPLSTPLADFDADHASNLAEYAHQTDPTAPNALPELRPRLDGLHFRIDAPLSNLPPDVQIGAESSPDLQNWSPSGIQALPDGFLVPSGSTPFFLRLTYDLLPTAP